jgi:hypothetical protein
VFVELFVIISTALAITKRKTMSITKSTALGFQDGTRDSLASEVEFQKPLIENEIDEEENAEL